MSAYLGVYLEETTKEEYAEARKDPTAIFPINSHGFIYSRGATRVLYIYSSGHYYKGPLMDRDVIPDYLAMQFKHVSHLAVFKQPEKQVPITSIPIDEIKAGTYKRPRAVARR